MEILKKDPSLDAISLMEDKAGMVTMVICRSVPLDFDLDNTALPPSVVVELGRTPMEKFSWLLGFFNLSPEILFSHVNTMDHLRLMLTAVGAKNRPLLLKRKNYDSERDYFRLSIQHIECETFHLLSIVSDILSEDLQADLECIIDAFTITNDRQNNRHRLRIYLREKPSLKNVIKYLGAMEGRGFGFTFETILDKENSYTFTFKKKLVRALQILQPNADHKGSSSYICNEKELLKGMQEVQKRIRSDDGLRFGRILNIHSNKDVHVIVSNVKKRLAAFSLLVRKLIFGNQFLADNIVGITMAVRDNKAYHRVEYTYEALENHGLEHMLGKTNEVLLKIGQAAMRDLGFEDMKFSDNPESADDEATVECSDDSDDLFELQRVVAFAGRTGQQHHFLSDHYLSSVLSAGTFSPFEVFSKPENIGCSILLMSESTSTKQGQLDFFVTSIMTADYASWMDLMPLLSDTVFIRYSVDTEKNKLKAELCEIVDEKTNSNTKGSVTKDLAPEDKKTLVIKTREHFLTFRPWIRRASLFYKNADFMTSHDWQVRFHLGTDKFADEFVLFVLENQIGAGVCSIKLDYNRAPIITLTFKDELSKQAAQEYMSSKPILLRPFAPNTDLALDISCLHVYFPFHSVAQKASDAVQEARFRNVHEFMSLKSKILPANNLFKFASRPLTIERTKDDFSFTDKIEVFREKYPNAKFNDIMAAILSILFNPEEVEIAALFARLEVTVSTNNFEVAIQNALFMCPRASEAMKKQIESRVNYYMANPSRQKKKGIASEAPQKQPTTRAERKKERALRFSNNQPTSSLSGQPVLCAKSLDADCQGELDKALIEVVKDEENDMNKQPEALLPVEASIYALEIDQMPEVVEKKKYMNRPLREVLLEMALSFNPVMTDGVALRVDDGQFAQMIAFNWSSFSYMMNDMLDLWKKNMLSTYSLNFHGMALEDCATVTLHQEFSTRTDAQQDHFLAAFESLVLYSLYTVYSHLGLWYAA